jgi:hypothetical protein
MCPTPPAATGSPRWRHLMWAVCGAVTVVTAVLLGLDIATARGATPMPAGVLDWSLAGFALAIVIPAAEWLVRYHVAGVRAELARIHARLDDHDGQAGALAAEIAAMRESVDLIGVDPGRSEEHSQDWWDGYAAQVEDRPPPVTGGDVLHLPTQRPGPPRAHTGRRA